jgi:hypothetical protein
MRKRAMIGVLTLGMALVPGWAWAIVGADTGVQWAAATPQQRIALANILSRQLGGDPQAYVQCLDAMFAGGANANVTIQDAAKECRAKQ